jgi:threonine dehydratase
MAIAKTTATPVLPVGLADVEAAARRLSGRVVRTPQARSQTLSKVTGAQVTVKFENLQFTASFKERGALNRMLLLDRDERSRGVIAVSAGNHAQGVARHAAALGIPATVVMPRTTPVVKVNRTLALGARVRLEGDTFECAMARGESIAADEGMVLIHPYDDAAVIAGQGTVASEMLDEDPSLEAIIVPVGGGGLIAGVATAVRDLAPHVEIVGVQSELYSGMAASVFGAHRGAGGPTVAEGIAVREPGEIPRQIIEALVDDVVVVPEVAIERAIGAYLDVEKVLAEGAGSASLAALMEYPDRFANRRVGLILSGGNIDLRFLADVILRDLTRAGQLGWLRLQGPDLPGTLARITGIVAEAGANIVEVVHRRHGSSLASRGAEVSLHLETNGSDHLSTVVSALAAAGYPVTTDIDA